jgi:biotin carboxylase
VRIIVLAGKPTDSLTYGFLPAAARLGLRVTLLTDMPARHAAAYAGLDVAPAEIHRCDVFDVRAVLDRAGRATPVPDAVFSNSDHLQTHAALAAAYLGLPGKDWRAAARVKNKALMRRHLAGAGAGPGVAAVGAWSIGPDGPVEPAGLRYPCVLKPAEGVASEDVYLVAGPAELAARVAETRRRRPGQALLAEEYLAGPLSTLETLGSASGVRVLGGFGTELSPPPYFIEQRMDWVPRPPEPVRAGVLAQLAALGVGFGACHTEFVLQEDRVRLVEVNYRIIGDDGDLFMAQLLDEPLFELVLRAHLGDDVAAEVPPVRPPRCGRLEYVLADRPGVLVAAPPAIETDRLVYRPLRAVGERIEITHSNRDYLGVLGVHGPGGAAVDAEVARFRATRTWEIAP